MPSKFTNYNTSKPLKEFPVKGSLASRVKDKIIDKVSDVMSYPARRNAQKSILRSNKDLETIKKNKAMGMRTVREPIEAGMMNQGTRLVAKPIEKQKAVLEGAKNFKPKSTKGYKYGVGVGP